MNPKLDGKSVVRKGETELQWRRVQRPPLPPARAPLANAVGAPQRHGRAACGRIAKLFVGQCYGFIRDVDGREIFFHRGDVHEGTAFNDFAIGDDVTFELLEDRISGPRAFGIKRRPGRPVRRDWSSLS